MKKINSILLLIILAAFSGCFAPVNLSFENAKMLKKGETKIQASFSSYYGPEVNFDDDSELMQNIHYHNNFGVAVGYGISDNFDLSLRYEGYKPQTTIEIFGETYDSFTKGINYLEVGSKLKIIDDKLAVGIPLALYLMEDLSFFSIDPRLYWTYRINNNIETTVTPKIHLFFGEGTGIAPGLTIGLGLSSNLDKWAFRPEIGYDGFFSFGFGINAYMKNNKKILE